MIYLNDFVKIDYKDNEEQNLIFEELVENGLAEQKENHILIPWAEIHNLTRIDQTILGLPFPYPYDIKVSTKNVFVNSDFNIELGFYEYDHGNQLFGNRVGSILKLDNGIEYLLSNEQYELCEAVKEFNNLVDKDIVSNLIEFSNIKQLSKKAASILDSVFQNEEVIVPEKIKLKPNLNDDLTVSITPEISNLNEKDKLTFQDKFQKFSKPKSTYSIKNENDKKVRIPLNKKQKDEFDKIKKLSNMTKDEINRLVDNPTGVFDSDIIDLSEFSDRVIEIGVYKPRFFPFVSPIKSEWIPGVIIDKGDSQKKVKIESIEELNEIEKKIEKAIQENKNTINIVNEEIEISEIKKIIPFARKQLENPKSKQDVVKNSKETKKVLIIKDNLFEEEYSEFSGQIDNLDYHYFQPPTLKDNITLFDYQKEGIAWLQTTFNNDFSGALLADDMGLGKTLQLLSFIDWHSSQVSKSQKPYLIVAPVSLLQNWFNEYKKFFSSEIELEILSSSMSNRLSVNLLTSKKIFLANYEFIRNSENQLIFAKINWAGVILDEAQKIKTPGTMVTNAIKAIKADFKIAATGTPVENSMVDLWSIVDFIAPGLLGSAKSFAKKYQHPVNKNITDSELEALGKNLRNEVGLYFKRRLKEDVLKNQLPLKKENYITLEMPEYQRFIYMQELEQSQSNQILTTILNLKKISDHPYLVNNDWRLKNDLDIINNSAKLQIVIKLLESIKSKSEKVIIFSEYRDTQKLLQRVIKNHFNLRKISIINGQTASIRKSSAHQIETRQDAIDIFSSVPGFNVIIMSPLAAGVGLNVVAANHVIHYSRHWNPAKESQATDRAYRIGQNKDVEIYYPISTIPNISTFDQILANLLKRKRNIADSAMFPSSINEIKVEDFSCELNLNENFKTTKHRLSITDFDSFEPYFFEAAIASLFKAEGYKVVLTPKSNDKGADIVCFSEKINYLIQVKKSKNSINHQSIGEVLTSKGFYEKVYHSKFELMIATNNKLNSNAILLAEDNNIHTFQRNDIITTLKTLEIYLSDIRKIENNRLKVVD